MPAETQSRSPFFDELERAVQSLGGYFNAHLHLDRAGTYHRTNALLNDGAIRDASNLPLSGKHALIPMIHASELYEPAALSDRVARYLDSMVACGTRRADTVVDTTDDRVGLNALEVFDDLKKRFADRMELRFGAYSPLGFRDDEPRRWSLFEDGARFSDFLGLLPERDDTATYPAHIGFRECCRRGVALARSLGKKIHIHVDQANHASEEASEIVMEVLEELGYPAPIGEPDIWLIHVISPSAYPDERFDELATRMAAWNVGVITCPSAAISMRQYRGLSAPTHNSIARVLEFLEHGVWVRVASDNICDVTSPLGTPFLIDEMYVLANAIRFYDVDVLARLAAGHPMNAAGRERIRSHLDEDRQMRRAVEQS